MRTHFVGLAALAMMAAAAPLYGQATLGPTLAWEDDLDLGIGGTFRTPLPAVGARVGFMADLLIFFPEGSDYFEINANVTLDLPLPDSSLTPFVLAGLTIGRTSGDVVGVDVSDTASRLNVGGGLEFDAGTLRPSAGLRIELGDGDAFVLFLSVPFALGR